MEMEVLRWGCQADCIEIGSPD